MRGSIRRFIPLIIWLIIGLIFTSQLHLLSQRTGGKMNWRDSFFWEVPRWCLWAFLAPLVTAIAQRYPWRKDRAARTITIHIVSAIVISAVHLVLFVLIFHSLRLSVAPAGNLMETMQFAFPLDFHVGIAVYFLIVVLTHYSESQQRLARLQAELTRAQLQALKMQLHPHFLFNTLNSISSYLHTDVEVADEMIGRLGDFLRMTLQNPATQEIALEREVEFLKEYLAIEHLRFQDRLQTEFSIDPETRSALVPNLILQPIAENAIRYGISANPNPGKLRITSKRMNDELQIKIEDNGPGMPREMREGIGIVTTRERLDHLYGSSARLEWINQSDGGAAVTLRIPFHLGESKV